MAVAPHPPVTTYRRSLLAFRVMAFVTGVVLLAGTIGLIVQEAGAHGIKHGVGLLWLFHGYMYLLYVLTVLNLGLKLRWHVVRIGLVALAGVVPTASFFAEHYVTTRVRAALSKGTARV